MEYIKSKSQLIEDVAEVLYTKISSWDEGIKINVTEDKYLELEDENDLSVNVIANIEEILNSFWLMYKNVSFVHILRIKNSKIISRISIYLFK